MIIWRIFYFPFFALAFILMLCNRLGNKPVGLKNAFD